MKRKLMALFLSAALCLTAMPVMAFAEEIDVSDESTEITSSQDFEDEDPVEAEEESTELVTEEEGQIPETIVMEEEEVVEIEDTLAGDVSAEEESEAEIIEEIEETLIPANDFPDGSLIYFGSYPQSQVTDSSLISSLASVSKSWKTYPYYSKNSNYVGSNGGYPMKLDTDIMSYADFTYNGTKYRAVKINYSRPGSTTLDRGENSRQDLAGYTPGNTYYFIWEPIKWVVLDSSAGLVLSVSMIDKQCFNGYYYVASDYRRYSQKDSGAQANYYSNSSIRWWLNGYTHLKNDGCDYSTFNFLQTAFSSSEQDVIQSRYCAATSSDDIGFQDKVFLPTKGEVVTYKDIIHLACSTEESVTDYASCQGGNNPLYAYTRSPGLSNTYSDVYVYCNDGTVTYANSDFARIDVTRTGITPMMKLDLSSSLVKSAEEVSEQYLIEFDNTNCTQKLDSISGSGTVTLPDISYEKKTTIRFQANGGTFVSGQSYYDVTVNHPITGWTDSNSETNSYVLGQTITLTANMYMVPILESVRYGSKLKISNLMKRDGYTFAGWYTGATGGIKMTSISYVPKTNKTLYAHWIKVVSKPEILSQPVSVTTVAGETVYFFVEATGEADLTYQWQYSKDNGSTWTNSTAATAKTQQLSTTAQTSFNGRLYRCIVKDASGNSVTSDSATLTVTSATSFAITTQPSNVSTTSGKTVTFKVVATGNSLTYQWQYSADNGSSWVNSTAASAKTAALSTTAQYSFSGRLYRCNVRDSSGKTLTSNNAKLVVQTSSGLGITSQPVNVSVTTGSTASFKVETTGTSLTYQWQYSVDNGSSWVNSTAASAKTATLSTTAKTSFNGRIFRCIVKDSAGKSVTSNTAKLTVTAAAAFAITGQPKSVTTTAGKSVSFTVTATGTNLTYQWQYRTSSTEKWVNSTAASAKTNTLSTTAKTSFNGREYRCIVTDGSGKTLTSNTAKLTVS